MFRVFTSVLRYLFEQKERKKEEEEEGKRITRNMEKRPPFHRAIHGRGRFHFEYEKSMILSMKRSLVIY